MNSTISKAIRNGSRISQIRSPTTPAPYRPTSARWLGELTRVLFAVDEESLEWAEQAVGAAGDVV
jgi:hypothetical protein